MLWFEFFLCRNCFRLMILIFVIITSILFYHLPKRLNWNYLYFFYVLFIYLFVVFFFWIVWFLESKVLTSILYTSFSNIRFRGKHAGFLKPHWLWRYHNMITMWIGLLQVYLRVISARRKQGRSRHKFMFSELKLRGGLGSQQSRTRAIFYICFS